MIITLMAFKFRAKSRRSFAAALLLQAAVVITGCSEKNDNPKSPQTDDKPTQPPVLGADFVSKSRVWQGTLRVDGGHGSLAAETIEPRPEPIFVTETKRDGIALRAFVKPIPLRKELVRLDVHVENLGEETLAGVKLTIIDDEGEVVDLTADPFSDVRLAKTGQEIAVGGIGPRGIARVILALPASRVSNVRMLASAQTAPFQTATSSSLALSPDGKELWAPFPDADMLTVIDTGTDKRVAQIALPGRPEGVAVTPDNALVAVVSSRGNTVTVIDRESRRVMQTLGESDGLGRDLRQIIASPDNQRLYVSGYVSDTLHVLERQGKSFRVTETITIGRRPTAMSLTPDGRHIFVSHFMPRGKIASNESWASVIATRPLSLVREAKFVDNFNLADSACLQKAYPNASLRELTTEGVITQLAGAFLTPGGSQAFAPGARVPGTVVVGEIGPNHGELSKVFFSGRKGELTSAFNFVIDARDPAKASPFPSHAILDMADVNFDQVKCSKLDFESEFAVTTPIGNNRILNLGTNLPSDSSGLSETSPMRSVAFSKGGRRAFLLAYAADELVVYDTTTLQGVSRKNLLLEGSNPNGMLVSSDGRKGYVSYANSPFLSVLDLSELAKSDSLPTPFYASYRFNNEPQYRRGGGFLTRMRLERLLGSIPDTPPVRSLGKVALVESDPLEPALRRGKILFESANPKKHPSLSASTLASCDGCHPQGGSDGSVWTTVEGERRTMSLFGGVAGRGWLHASATHADISDFTGTIVRERLGGNLSDADRRALGRYASFGITKLQAPATDPKRVSVGKKIFDANCSGCHAGEKFTSGKPVDGNPYGGSAKDVLPGVFDVGSATNFAGASVPLYFEAFRSRLPEAPYTRLLRGDRALGSGDPVQTYFDFTPRPDRARGVFKATSLVNVWHNPLFFHDGRYDSLDDVVEHFNARLGLSLSAEDKLNVVEFLKTL